MLGRVLRYQPLLGIFVATLAAAGVVGCGCVLLPLGAPMLAFLVRHVLAAAESAADDSPGRQANLPVIAPGVTAWAWLVVIVVATAACGLGTGVWLNEALHRLPPWGYAASIAAALVGAAVTGAICAPLAYVPFAASDRELGLGAAIARGLEVAQCDARSGLARTGALAALALVAAPVLLGSLELVEKDWGAASLPAIGPSLWLAASIVASRYVVARRLSPPKDASRRMPPVVKPAVAVSGLAVAALLGTIGWAAWMPTPASVVAPSQDRLQPVALSTTEDARIPQTFVRLRALPSGDLFVSTPDGGGAGVVRCPIGATARSALVLRAQDGDMEVRWPARAVPAPTCVVALDDSGVRLDDDTWRRVVQRGGVSFGAGVLLALLGLVVLVFRALRYALDARVLRTAENVHDGVDGPRALVGSAIGSPARTFQSDDGQIRFALPSPRADGERLTVVGRFAKLADGPRDTTRPLPLGARVLAGDAEDARRGLAALASRTALYATGAVVGGSLFAIVVLATLLLSHR